MTDLATTYTISNGSPEDADEVQQNFTDIVDYVNDHTVKDDGSVAMTAALTLDGAVPTNAAHAASKAYVDGVYVKASGSTAVTYTADAWVNQKFSTEDYDYINGLGNTAGGNYNLSTGVFTAPRTGVYLVEFTIEPANTETGRYAIAATCSGPSFRHNGPRFEPEDLSGEGSGVVSLHMCVPVRCTSGETIIPQVNVHGGSPTRSIGHHLTIAWLHA